MNVRSSFRLSACVLFLIALVAPAARAAVTPAQAITNILNRPDSRLDYLEAAVTFDRLIESRDTPATKLMIDRLADAARQMAGPRPTDAYKLAAVRQAIYVAGAWNYGRAFAYDSEDPLGRNLRSRLLSNYVSTRKGNCVSMPVLFLIVADRVGLNVHLAAAPLHWFVRYTDAAGADHNLEATSGGHEARTDWYRINLPMSDRAIQSGAYMRTLSKRETVAAMAATVIDYLIGERRYQEAMEVADAVLAVNPRDTYALVKKGTAIAGLIKTEYGETYAGLDAVPVSLRARYRMMAAANQKAFRDAEALGWEDSAK